MSFDNAAHRLPAKQFLPDPDLSGIIGDIDQFSGSLPGNHRLPSCTVLHRPDPCGRRASDRSTRGRERHSWPGPPASKPRQSVSRSQGKAFHRAHPDSHPRKRTGSDRAGQQIDFLRGDPRQKEELFQGGKQDLRVVSSERMIKSARISSSSRSASPMVFVAHSIARVIIAIP